MNIHWPTWSLGAIIALLLLLVIIVLLVLELVGVLIAIPSTMILGFFGILALARLS